MSTSVAHGIRPGFDFRSAADHTPAGGGREPPRVGRIGAPPSVVLEQERIARDRYAGRSAAPAVARDRQPDPHAPRFGHAGLTESLAGFPDRPESLPAILLTSLIHSMGGAPTSIARGAYLSFAV